MSRGDSIGARGNGCGLLALCWLCACNVYSQEYGMQTDAVLDGGPSEPAPAANVDAGLVVGSSPDPPCAHGQCWWSVLQANCPNAGMPTSADRPMADTLDENAVNAEDIYLGWTQLRVGVKDPGEGDAPMSVDNEWQAIGLNIDGLCTNSITCPASQDTSCRSSAPQLPFDGELCRDNSFARILTVVGQVPEVGPRFGLYESALNCGLRRGSYNVITRIRGYNGQPDDSTVRVDWYVSDGLDAAPGWECANDGSQAFVGYPIWRTSATWRVDAADVIERVVPAGGLPDSKVTDVNAYVRAGYLVSQFPDGAALRLAGDGRPFRGLDVTLRKAVWVGRISRAQDNTWQMNDGLVAGRMHVEDVFQAFRRSGFCRAGGLETFYQSIAAYVLESADVLASGTIAPEAGCDALSFGIGFEAAQVTPGSISDAPKPIECCAPGRSAEDCLVQCGDGKVSGDETCDTAIAAGSPGACPMRCETDESCKRAGLKGAGCAIRCVEEPVTAMKSGDGCCPPGADSTKDGDCPSSCGNGTLEPGETCDPPSTCSACEVEDPCLLGNRSGRPEECNAQCRWSTVAECSAGDRCCPEGCTSTTDMDCSSTCGDGRLQPQTETCEAGTTTPCPTSCDDGIRCTLDFRTGSAANCNVRCSHIEIVRSIPGDRCCPEGANTLADSDCAPECGNGVVEGNETCDDGNRIEGDGCSQNCQAMGDLDVCLEAVGSGFQDACAVCVCEQCAPEVKPCFLAENPEEVKLCADMVKCAGEAACDGVACYCGPDLLRCSLGFPSGPCRAQIEAATGSGELDTISSRSIDPNYPIGRANAVGGCAWNRCADACGIRTSAAR